MSMLGPNNNGRNTYKTQVSKFLYGGRLDNLLKGKNKIVNGMEDPSFFAFNFGIDLSTTGLFSIKNSGQNVMLYDLNLDRNYSVLDYLRNAISPNTNEIISKQGKSAGNELVFADMKDINVKTEGVSDPMPKYQTFPQEYNDMKKFTEGFHEITTNHPYMLQTVEGLQEAYKRYYNTHKDSYLGGGNDAKIKISCLEALDLRMSALFDSYFRAVYNHKYRRMNIPRNLLRFDCWVLVHDMRNLAMDNPSLLNASFGEPVDENIVNNLSTVLFKFKNCMFDIEEIGTMFETINNAETNQTKFTFTFIYNDVEIYVNSLADMLEAKSNDEKKNISNTYREQYDLLDIKQLNDSMGSLNITDTITNIGKTIFNYATQGSTMGNVYDESWAGILSSMMSSISNVGVSSILNNAIGKGISLGKDKLKSTADKIMGFGTEQSAFKDPYTNTVYTNSGKQGRGNHPGSTPEKSEFENTYADIQETHHETLSADNIYSNVVVSEPEPLLADNIYDNFPNSHEPLVEDNIYQNITIQHEPLVEDNLYGDLNLSHSNDYNESLIDEPSPREQFLGGTVDMSTNGTHEQIQTGVVFDEPEPREPYQVEYADMSTNGTHQNIEEGNIYENLPSEPYYGFLGNVYSISNTTENFIPVNVYDRIIESTKNEISIDKIFIPPTKSPSLVYEKTQEPIKETTEHTLEETSVYMEEAKNKIKQQIFSIGNIYID